MIKFIPLLLVFITVSGFKCSKNNNSFKQKEEPSGGPCSYSTQILPAQVIDVFQNPNDTSVFDAWFEIKNPENISINAPDTFVYSIHSNRGYISHSDILKYNIKPGTIVQYKIMHIIEGSCTDYMEELSLEKYKHE